MHYLFRKAIVQSHTLLFLQLLEPGRYPALLKALYGLLMLLPQQSGAFMILRTRLKSVPTHALMHMSSHPPETEYSQRGKSGGSPVSTAVASVLRRAASMKDDRRQGLGGLGPSPLEEGTSPAEGEGGRAPLPAIDFAGKLQQFELMQRQHQLMRAAERQKQQQGTNGLPAETSPQVGRAVRLRDSQACESTVRLLNFILLPMN